MNIITSKSNKTVQEIKSLNTAKGRMEHNMFIVEGEHMVQEAISSDYTVKYIVCDITKADKYNYLIKDDLDVLYLDSRVYNTIADTKSPQGISVVLDMDTPNKQFSNKIVMLNGVQDPGNVGTIIRTADAAGFGMVIMDANCADIYNPKTLRSTMGSIFHISCIRVKSLHDIINELKAKGYCVYSTSLEGYNYYNREYDKDKLVVLFGNEGNGIDDDILRLSTHKFKLPMLGRAESLNVAVACGIIIYDIVRREHE